MRRAWVVGHSGMLGRAVCQALARRGVDLALPPGRVDIGDPQAPLAAARLLGRAGEVAAVFNCAAMTGVDDCEDQEAAAERVNGAGAGHVARAAAAIGAPLVHVSTDYVFGGEADRPLGEGVPPRPLNAYGRTKAAGEAEVARVAGAVPGAWAATVRTSWLFGGGERHFVATMLRLMAEREEIGVVDDQRGRPTSAVDLAEAMVALVGLGDGRRAPPGTYHFANRGEVTWHGFASEIWRQARARGLPLRLRSLWPTTSLAQPRRARRPAYSVLATDKIEHALEVAPRPFTCALGTYLDGRAGAAPVARREKGTL